MRKSSDSEASENRDSATFAGGSASLRLAATTRPYIASGNAAGAASLSLPCQASNCDARASSDHNAEPKYLRWRYHRRAANHCASMASSSLARLVEMERVAIRALFRILDRVRRGQDEHAGLRQHAGDLRDHARLVLARKMLDRLERHDRVDASFGERQLGRASHLETQVGALAIAILRVRDNVGGNVDADDARGDAASSALP
jgi:hypothetical protein